MATPGWPSCTCSRRPSACQRFSAARVTARTGPSATTWRSPMTRSATAPTVSKAQLVRRSSKDAGRSWDPCLPMILRVNKSSGSHFVVICSYYLIQYLIFRAKVFLCFYHFTRPPSPLCLQLINFHFICCMTVWHINFIMGCNSGCITVSLGFS